MCGIAGVFDLRGRRAVDRAVLDRMSDVLAHRGPDGAGAHVVPGLGLAHRRLAVIDLAGGHQPLFNEDGSVCVVFNGEIYGFAGLAAQLARRGHRFRSRSDTEVIVHAWEEWGEDCLSHLTGMFAFALWDERRETLVLARDRLGEKPLYYAPLADGRLIFASELKALLVHPGLGRDLDPCAVEDYFALGYVPDPRCIYRGVFKLPPAHLLVLRRGEGMAPARAYWRPRFDAVKIGAEEAAEELASRLHGVVAERLVADVPLGAFLSGGVDSSGVVAAMAGVAAGPVKTFSIAFGTPGYDESPHAAVIARRYGTDHRVRRVDPDAVAAAERLAAIYDEPFADSSALPTLALCAMAREQVTVAMSGDGGDELFAGYRRHRFHAWQEEVRRLLPAALRRPLFGVLGGLWPKLDWAPRPLRAKATLLELAADAADAYFASVSVNSDALRRGVFTPALRRELQGYSARAVIADAMAACDSDDPVAQVRCADLRTWLPGDILTKVDRASMAVSLEVRVPLLDHRLVEWAARLPAPLLIGGGQGKRVLKRALEGRVPHDILYRPKQGFRVPLAEWFRGPLLPRARAIAVSPALAATGWIDLRRVGRLVDRHASGLADHSATLWTLLAFDAFLRRIHMAEKEEPALPL